MALIDHKFTNTVTGKTKTVEVKYNTSGYTANQKTVLANDPTAFSTQRVIPDDLGNLGGGIQTSAGINATNDSDNDGPDNCEDDNTC